MGSKHPVDYVNVDTLCHLMSRGVPLIAMDDRGATVAPWGGCIPNLAAFTKDPPVLYQWLSQGYSRFAYVPGLALKVVIDLDMKHGKDGVSNFRALLREKNVVLPWDILSAPVFAETPSFGYHIFFQQPTAFRTAHWNPAPGVDIIHWAHLATAPGSAKFPDGGGEPRGYVLHGNWDDIPPLPPALIPLIRKPVHTYSLRKPVVKGPRKTFAEMEWILERQGKDAAHAGRNVHLFHLAVFARNQGYSFEETLDYGMELAEYNTYFPFLPDEIERTVMSAFKGQRDDTRSEGHSVQQETEDNFFW